MLRSKIAGGQPSNLIKAGEKAAIGFLGAGALGALAPLQMGQLMAAISCVAVASVCSVVLIMAAAIGHKIMMRTMEQPSPETQVAELAQPAARSALPAGGAGK